MDVALSDEQTRSSVEVVLSEMHRVKAEIDAMLEAARPRGSGTRTWSQAGTSAKRMADVRAVLRHGLHGGPTEAM